MLPLVRLVVCILLVVAACTSPPEPEKHGGGVPGPGGTPGAGANSGAGGTGGSGGGGSGGTVAVPTDVAEWIGSTAGWLPVPGTEEGDYCQLAVADPTGIPLPDLRWEPCGSGCEFSRLLDGFNNRANLVSADIETIDGKDVPILVILDAAEAANGLGVLFQRLVNLEDGRTLAVTRLSTHSEVAHCYHTPALAGAFSTMLRVKSASGERFVHFGYWEPSKSDWTWKLPRVVLGDSIMASTPGGRQFFFTGISNIVAMLGESTERTVIESEGAFEPYAIARAGSGIMWSKFVEEKGTVNTEIRRWTETSGLHLLFPRVEGITCALAWGDRWIVGMTGLPLSGTCTGGISNPRFWMSPVTQNGKGPLQLGPSLDLENLTIWRVATRGEFLAAGGYLRGGRGTVLILSKTDQKSFRHIIGRDNRFIFDPSVILSDKYLYFVEGDSSQITKFDTVYRYDLSMFDQWFNTWGSPVEILE